MRSYFVRSADFEKIKSWSEKQHLMGRWFPESGSSYQIFSREQYWSPAYNFFNQPYYGRDEWEEVIPQDRRDDSIGEVMVTAERYNWESGGGDGYSFSYLSPRKIMYESLNMEYSISPGEWLDKSGNVVCFDPSLDEEDESGLFLRLDALEEFLRLNDMRILWTVLGEKRILGERISSKHPNQWLELSGTYSLEEGRVSGSTMQIFGKSSK